MHGLITQNHKHPTKEDTSFENVGNLLPVVRSSKDWKDDSVKC